MPHYQCVACRLRLRAAFEEAGCPCPRCGALLESARDPAGAAADKRWGLTERSAAPGAREALPDGL